jgi:hypothetical protein
MTSRKASANTINTGTLYPDSVAVIVAFDAYSGIAGVRVYTNSVDPEKLVRSAAHADSARAKAEHTEGKTAPVALASYPIAASAETKHANVGITNSSDTATALALAENSVLTHALASYPMAASAETKHANVGITNSSDTATALALAENSVLTHAAADHALSRPAHAQHPRPSAICDWRQRHKGCWNHGAEAQADDPVSTERHRTEHSNVTGILGTKYANFPKMAAVAIDTDKVTRPAHSDTADVGIFRGVAYAFAVDAAPRALYIHAIVEVGCLGFETYPEWAFSNKACIKFDCHNFTSLLDRHAG